MSPDELLVFTPAAEAGRATLAVDAAVRSPHAVNPLLFGKFCEHLGANINQGMEAQTLYNPTFGRVPLSEKFFEQFARRHGLPADNTLAADWADGAAPGWMRIGPKDAVRLSPEPGPQGNLVQRFETLATAAGSPAGIGQWTHLPLHRVRRFEYRIVARAATACTLRLQLGEAAAELALTPQWRTLTGRLEVAADAPPDAPLLLQLVSAAPANVVLDRVLLYPADHVNHADPDVIAMLRDARLPLLRWPGGNFVSGYDWRDGVGPVDLRPTKPNPAWGGNIESNLFGTHEFLDFCRAVGCEPLICVNAGGGRAQDAAAWVEYCNGGPGTPMGRLRAANGHAAPFGVHYWEIGNEIYGTWQIGWTTPAGNVDRFRRFRERMLAADPTIRILACGALHDGVDAEWNRALLADAPEADLHTHHILIGGRHESGLDAAELFHAFMAYPVKMRADYLLMRRRMLDAGIAAPRMAITELQEFASIRDPVDDPVRRTPPAIPNPAAISEALYFTVILHECIRLGDFVEMITHSATVNHGGGLRKQRERVWANPVHYAHALGRELAGGTPLGVRLSCGTFSTGRDFHGLPRASDVPDLDAMAVLAADGKSVLLSLVHRAATAGPVELTLDLGGLAADGPAEVVTLAGESFADANTAENPRRIVPRASTAAIHDGRARLSLPPFSLTHVRAAV